MLTLNLLHDADCESPLEYSGWKLISFNHRMTNFVDPRTLDLNGIGWRRKFATNTALWLDYYEHGLGAWSLAGSGTQCRWDTAKHGGILMLNPEQDKDYYPAKDKRVEDAKLQLGVYNAWMNGQCFGYVLERIGSGSEEIDSCWGFIDEGNDKDLEYVLDQIRDAADGEPIDELGGDYREIWTLDELNKPSEAGAARVAEAFGREAESSAGLCAG